MLILPTSLLLGSTVASAAPNAVPNNNAFCSKIKSDVTRANQYGQATAYCSSLLNIPIVLSTKTLGCTQTVSTATTSTTIEAARTSTVVISVGAGQPQSTSTIWVTRSLNALTTTTTVTSALTGCPTSPPWINTPKLLKRTSSRRSKPPSCLAADGNVKQASSACMCLQIPVSTRMITVNGQAVATATVTKTRHVLVTSTSTPVVTITSLVPAVVSTVTSTTEVTTEATATRVLRGPLNIADHSSAAGNLYGRGQGSRGEGFTALWTGGSIDPTSPHFVYLLTPEGKLIIRGLDVGPAYDQVLYGEAQLAGASYTTLNTIPADEASKTSVVCTIGTSDDGTCPLTCTVNGRSTPNGAAEGDWIIGERPADEDVFYRTVVPVVQVPPEVGIINGDR